MLFDRATTAAYLGGAYVLGPDGRVLASQNDEIDASVSLGDRDYFLVHQRNPAVGLYFSHPYRSRLRDGKLSIGLTRRINEADGRFGGVALLAIRIEYFQHLLDRINTGELGSVFIVMDDGTLLARKPFSSRDIGSSIAKSPTFQVMAAHDSGSYIAISAVDGVRRMFTYARVPGTPLIAVVAPSVDEVLAPWRRRSRIAGVLTLAFGAVFVMVSWLLAFVLRDNCVRKLRWCVWPRRTRLPGLAIAACSTPGSTKNGGVRGARGNRCRRCSSISIISSNSTTSTATRAATRR